MYRVILADDHTIFRDGLKSLINKEPDLKIVAEAKDGTILLEKLKTVKCDVVVLDISMPNLSGLAALKEIKNKFPQINILMLTMQKDQEHFKHAMSAGALGYILKDDAYEQLVLAIRLVAKGQRFVSPSMSGLVTERFIRSVDEVETPSLEILTHRETQVLKLIAQGLPNKNIATKLKISVRTVESHRFHLMDKLGIKSTANIVRYAVSKGLV